jgi:hypothetical protein
MTQKKESTMSTWNDLFIRDSLQDTGTLPSNGVWYAAPDIICSQQTTYANPTQQFGTAASYATDPNQPVVAQQNNYFYVRAKNLAAQSQAGQMYVYWTKASLVMTPDLWFNQPLQVSINGRWQPNNPLVAVPQNGITVAQQPFAWTPPAIAPGDHFCLVGAVGTSLHAWPPPQAPTFANFDAFLYWLRNNGNICLRNLTLVSNPAAPQWDRVDGLHNPWNEARPLVIAAECKNVPTGTQITLKCTALEINTTKRTSKASETVYTQGVTCDAGFSGYVETMAVLPTGTRWPVGAQIRTIPYFGTRASSPAARFAEDFGGDARHPGVARALELAGGAEYGVLVAAGSCATAYTGGAAGALEG